MPARVADQHRGLHAVAHFHPQSVRRGRIQSDACCSDGPDARYFGAFDVAIVRIEIVERQTQAEDIVRNVVAHHANHVSARYLVDIRNHDKVVGVRVGNTSHHLIALKFFANPMPRLRLVEKPVLLRRLHRARDRRHFIFRHIVNHDVAQPRSERCKAHIARIEGQGLRLSVKGAIRLDDDEEIDDGRQFVQTRRKNVVFAVVGKAIKYLARVHRQRTGRAQHRRGFCGELDAIAIALEHHEDISLAVPVVELRQRNAATDSERCDAGESTHPGMVTEQLHGIVTMME